MKWRSICEDDLPRIKELQAEHEWEFGPDFIGGGVLVDEQGVIRGVGGSWMMAETHILIDPTWKTPAMRYALLCKLHTEMSSLLASKCIFRVVTWFERAESFGRRLQRLGWVKSARESWHYLVR